MNPDPTEHTGGGEELSMGVDASNELRAKLGLKPLRTGKSLKEQGPRGTPARPRTR